MIQADVNYVVPGHSRSYSYTFEPPSGEIWTNEVLQATPVKVHDARPLSADGHLSLDTNGFERISSAAPTINFHDEAAVKEKYYPEVESLLRSVTGAATIKIFDHTLRDSENGNRATPSLRAPVRRVHCDQTVCSAPRRVRAHLSPEEAERCLGGRFAIINVWRPLEVVKSFPLAMCDARTIVPDDLVPADLIYRNNVGEIYLVSKNEAHRWFYFPNLSPDELILLKIYDSLEDGTARFTPHTAVEDPNTPADAPARRSIEVRALLFW